MFLSSVTCLAQDALSVCRRPAPGPAASLRLAAAGSVQHQVVWRHQSLQRYPDEHHHHGLRIIPLFPFKLTRQNGHRQMIFYNKYLIKLNQL